ncbi:hypothetical protein SLEP1_g26411 [Rubroshorea leprosula]|uniref:Uncharacterized protein n=1 Tax=Rubroshorea leprosula TaxID=152421 RepID=A0AAV5JSE0_9ROSI|nr:hypothetical protein SLEP1_g26411 [Rubroshorea leprosula]
MYSAIRSLPLDGTMGHGGEYQGSLSRLTGPTYLEMPAWFSPRMLDCRPSRALR